MIYLLPTAGHSMGMECPDLLRKAISFHDLGSRCTNTWILENS